MPPATEALQSASQFGPSIWFAVFIILTIVVCGALYIKYVGNPARVAAEDNNRKLTECVLKLAVVVDRTDMRTTDTHSVVDGAKRVLDALAVAKVVELEAIAKVAKKAGVDVQKELAEATGIMRFARQELLNTEVPA